MLEYTNIYIVYCPGIDMKKNVMTAIDEDVHNLARQKGINVSKVLNDALTRELKLSEVKIDNSIETCQFCGKEGRKETADDVESSTNIKNEVKEPNLLCWLWPDERWICNACLRQKARWVPVAQKF